MILKKKVTRYGTSPLHVKIITIVFSLDYPNQFRKLALFG